MRSLSIMIKPASANCNLNCTYCFYHDIASDRNQYSLGFMKPETLETIVRKSLEYADGTCTFAFQGGEPTLAGLEFYRQLIQMQKQYNQHQTKILNAIQTNGTLLDDDWAVFLQEHHFLVGLSLDGPAEIHNLHRLDNKQNETFNQTMAAARLLTKHKVEFNILSVVTGRSARGIESIYRFFAKHQFGYLQFIPCMEPMKSERGTESYNLSPEGYQKFLCRLFELWYADFKKGHYISIRLFDNLVHMLQRKPPEACNLNGQCSVNLLIEGNGNVYPCDFYAYDQWQLGNINDNSIHELLKSDNALRFIAESKPVPKQCLDCEYYYICRNGCKRDRVLNENQESQLYYCKAHQQFFKYALPRLQQIANWVR